MKLLHLLKTPQLRATKRILFFILFLQIPALLFGQDKALLFFNARELANNTKELKSKFKRYNIIQFESSKLEEYVHYKNLSVFHLNLGIGKEWQIDLQPSNIVSADYKLKIQTEAGLQTISSNPNFLYKGKVKGSNSNEEVRLAIKEGFIYGSVQNGGREYFIEPLNRFTAAKKDEYIVYEAKDVMATEPFACGFQDRKSAIETEQQRSLRGQTILSTICKKIKFISVADYSIYQKFGSDVNAVETALLANLNLAEGAFASLNLGSDGSTDVGSDKLQFEMEEVVVSVCKECDVVGNSENVAIVSPEFQSWLKATRTNNSSRIFNFWTTRNLYLSNGGVVGYTDGVLNCSILPPVSILKGISDDAAFLRVLVAHETGHALGCDHDNSVKAGVTGFIMYSAANGSRTRFSTLADFGGIPYSSQQAIRNLVLRSSNCLEDCTTNNCENIKDLKVSPFSSYDSIQISWIGSGTFLVKYKVKDSLNYELSNIKETAVNTVTLKNLQPCALYQFDVQKLCSPGVESKASSIIFNPSFLSVKPGSINIRDSLYDLKADLECRHCMANEYSISIDHKPYQIFSSGSGIIVKDLFADGAKHRIDITKDSTRAGCSTTIYFTAPYYRNNSQKILSADFNDCNFPAGWSDSVIKQHPSFAEPFWFIDNNNFYTTRTPRGTFDSTCMVYYNSYGNAYRGTLALLSPKVDLTKFYNTYLHFDFSFISHKALTGQDFGSLWVEVFDGTSWQKVYEYTHNDPAPRSLTQIRNLWDSIPPRAFINLDKYRNKEFQISLIIDDGYTRYGFAGQVFAALNNIQIDGYLRDSSATNNITVYPNPTKGKLFVQFEQQPASAVSYSIIDVSGRLVVRGFLNNNDQIDLNGLSSGMYLIKFYQNNQPLGSANKIIKH